jgi:SRR1
MSSNSNTESEYQWKVVTRNDKKRVIRKSAIGRNEKLVTNETSNRFSEPEGFEYQSKLYQCLEKCCDDIIQTDLYHNFISYWNDLVKAHISENNDDSFLPVQEIICYGLGNFSETPLTHYSASFWQLAFVLSIRKFFVSRQLPTCDDTYDDIHVVDELVVNPPSDNGNISISADNKIEKKSSTGMISMTYFDPCSTSFEKEFIRQKLEFCTILEDNEHGNRKISRFEFNTDDKHRRKVLLFFMPHCPAQLYENVTWSNWDHIVPELEPLIDDTAINMKAASDSNVIVIIGNSLHDIAEKKYGEGVKPKQTLQVLLPWIQQIPLRTSKEDEKRFPGNIVGAFNDTYMTYWTTSIDVNSALIRKLQRPLKNPADDYEDKELL